MHESGLMRGVVAELEALARMHDSTRIVSVTLQIRDTGDYSGAHFAEHLRAVSAGTVIEDAAINVDMVCDPGHSNGPEITIKTIEVPA